MMLGLPQQGIANKENTVFVMRDALLLCGMLYPETRKIKHEPGCVFPMTTRACNQVNKGLFAPAYRNQMKRRLTATARAQDRESGLRRGNRGEGYRQRFRLCPAAAGTCKRPAGNCPAGRVNS
jgi:hypothetical protein